MELLRQLSSQEGCHGKQKKAPQDSHGCFPGLVLDTSQTAWHVTLLQPVFCTYCFFLFSPPSMQKEMTERICHWSLLADELSWLTQSLVGQDRPVVGDSLPRTCSGHSSSLTYEHCRSASSGQGWILSFPRTSGQIFLLLIDANLCCMVPVLESYWLTGEWGKLLYFCTLWFLRLNLTSIFQRLSLLFCPQLHWSPDISLSIPAMWAGVTLATRWYLSHRQWVCGNTWDQPCKAGGISSHCLHMVSGWCAVFNHELWMSPSALIHALPKGPFFPSRDFHIWKKGLDDGLRCIKYCLE